jgi:hypothetical protein
VTDDRGRIDEESNVVRSPMDQCIGHPSHDVFGGRQSLAQVENACQSTHPDTANYYRATSVTSARIEQESTAWTAGDSPDAAVSPPGTRLSVRAVGGGPWDRKQVDAPSSAWSVV